ncbi:MAG: hypothetical protein A3G25_09545 [Betaproteobacteria bacterium RIFCSPLOWO2_12_FULL_63_13]|nr:MAG: hypothetical protein A3G25_09545 [Betaproteobacteria bacterium RIFCSPLOWO2_12_FULL_63_13]
MTTDPKRDYWLSKLFFDLQTNAAAEEFRMDRERVLDRYPLKPEIRLAVVREDVATLARLVNPYLLRFYFFAIGKSEEWFLERIRKTAPDVRDEVARG